VAAPLIRSREATEAAQTGWSVWRQPCNGGLESKFGEHSGFMGWFHMHGVKWNKDS